MPDKPQSLFRLYNRGFGWMTFFLLPFAIGLTLITMFEGRTFERLRDDGATTTATVTDKDYEVRTDSDGDRTTTYYLSFTFEVGARLHQSRESVGRSFWNGTEPGDLLPLRYWRPDPQVNEIEPGATRKTIWITKILAVILLTAAGFWTERCWRKAARAIRVRDRGEERRATVTDHFRTSVRVNKQPRFRLEWRDEAGVTGRSYMYAERALAPYPVGSEITVYADPAGRLPAVWQGDVGPKRTTT